MSSKPSRRATWTLVLALLAPLPAQAQTGSTVVGALLGTAGGSYLSLALTTAAARAGHYAYSPAQALWRAVPIPVGAVAGGVLGHQGDDRLRDSVLSGLVGFAAGTAVGALVGDLAWERPEGVWSGAIIGSGLGLLAGGLVGAFRGGGDEGGSTPAVLAMSIPVGP